MHPYTNWEMRTFMLSKCSVQLRLQSTIISCKQRVHKAEKACWVPWNTVRQHQLSSGSEWAQCSRRKHVNQNAKLGLPFALPKYGELGWVKSITEIQQLRIGANMTQLKYLALHLSEICSMRTPIKTVRGLFDVRLLNNVMNCLYAHLHPLLQVYVLTLQIPRPNSKPISKLITQKVKSILSLPNDKTSQNQWSWDKNPYTTARTQTAGNIEENWRI